MLNTIFPNGHISEHCSFPFLQLSLGGGAGLGDTIPPPSLTSTTLGKLLNLSASQFPLVSSAAFPLYKIRYIPEETTGWKSCVLGWWWLMRVEEHIWWGQHEGNRMAQMFADAHTLGVTY